MKKQNLIIIDENKITHFILSKMFLRNSFFSKPITFLSALEALDFLTKSNVADDSYYLIFLDINMPVMNGWEFLDTFSKNNYKEIFNNTKVVVLSSTIDPRDIEKSKTYSMVIDFLSKPITIDMLEFIKNKA
jgi:CheY-like chemotaxis protein